MTDREALLRAVVANPDDDTPRLIYADCLDELGGDANAARGRFIRLQVDLARDPSGSWFARSDRLSEVARLAGLYAPEWLKELPNWAVAEMRARKPGADDFTRGFLERVHVPPVMFAKQGDRLLDVAPIQHVDVTLPPMRHELGVFLASRALERVRSLAVQCSGYVAFGDTVAQFAARTRSLFALESLTLPVGVTDAGATDLARAVDLRSLRVLRVVGNCLTATGVSALFNSPKLPNLQELHVSGNWGIYHSLPQLRDQFPGKKIHH